MPTVDEIIARRKKILESGGSLSSAQQRPRTVQDILRERGYRSPESYQHIADAQERSLAPVKDRLYSDDIEAQRLKAIPAQITKPVKQQPIQQPIKTVQREHVQQTQPQLPPNLRKVYEDELKQSSDTDLDAIAQLVRGKPVTTNIRASNRPAVVGGSKVADSGPGYGEVIGKSLLSGMAQADMSALNVPRMIHKGISNVWDAITPDFLYQKEKDPLTKLLDKGVEHFEKQATETRESLGELKGLKRFLNTGLESLPTVFMAGVLGARVCGGAAKGGLGATPKLAPEISRMIPFGVIAGGGYARDAENEGASYTQQVLYGALSGLAEMATETPIVEGVLDTISKLGAGELIEQGAKTFIGKYGKVGLSWLSNILKEGLQEAVIEPITGTIRKMTYDRNMPIYGEGGVISPKQMGEAFYGGVAMSTILGALGLPAYAASRKYVENKISENKPLDSKDIEKTRELMSQDIEKIESETQKPVSKPVQTEITSDKTDLKADRDILESSGIEKVVDEIKIEPEQKLEATEALKTKTNEFKEEETPIDNLMYKYSTKMGTFRKKLKGAENTGKKVRLQTFGEVEIVDDTDKSLVRVKNKFGTVIPIGRKHFENLLIEEVKPEEVKPEEVKPEEVKPEEVKPEEVKPEEVQPEETPTETNNYAEPKQEDTVEKPQEVAVNELLGSGKVETSKVEASAETQQKQYPDDKIFTADELIELNNKLLGYGAPTQYDNVGYNKIDYGFALSLRNQSELTDNQLSTLANILYKYGKTQLGIDPTLLKNTAEYYKDKKTEIELKQQTEPSQSEKDIFDMNNLPELSGSPKQIKWANDIKDNTLKIMKRFINENKDSRDYDKYIEAYNIYKGLTKSRDVIDTRGLGGRSILEEYAKGNNLLKGFESEGVKSDEARTEKRVGQFTGLDYRIPVEESNPKEKDENGLFTTRGGKLKDGRNVLGEEISKTLRRHQIDGVNLAIAAVDEYGGFILSDGTGAGKTRQEIAFADYYLKKGKKVLIVTTNATNISKSFKTEADKMGVALSEVVDGQIKDKVINVTTYTSLSKIKTNADYIVFDESHNLKNKDTAKTKAGTKLADNAKGVLFASATPFDKALQIRYLTKMGIFKNRSFTKVMGSLGYKYEEKNIGRKTVGEYVRSVPVEEAEARLSAFFDELAQLGLIIKREVPMDRVEIFYKTVNMAREAMDTLNEIFNHFASKFGVNEEGSIRGIGQVLMLMTQRRFQESFKINETVNLIRQELKEGRRPVVFATRINDTELAEYSYDASLGSLIKYDSLVGEGTISKIGEILAKEGIKVAKIYGAGNVDKEVDKFQSGKADVAIVTPQKGGAGLSLDDTVGDKPRTMIVITPPFSGVDNVQMAGRINRLNTASNSRIIYLFANTDVDEWNKSIISEKMKTLNAVVKGDIEKLDTGKLAEETEVESAVKETDDIRIVDGEVFYKDKDATTAKRGYAWFSNKRSRFDKGRKAIQLPEFIKQEEESKPTFKEEPKTEPKPETPAEQREEFTEEVAAEGKQKAELIKNPKSNTDKLQNALINEQLTIDGVEIPKGKKHGFDYEQRYQIADELIEGSKTDKEKVTIKVRNDGTMNVVNSEPVIADILNELGVKKKEVKIPYKIDKNAHTTIYVDSKNNLASPNGYYAAKVTEEEIQALKEFAENNGLRYVDDMDFTDKILKPIEKNIIELTETPKVYEYTVGKKKAVDYIFKIGDTLYSFDKKYIDLFNKDGNKFYVSEKNTQAVAIKDSDDNLIGIIMPVKSNVTLEHYDSLNPATGKEFFSKPKKSKGTKSSAIVQPLTGHLPQIPQGTGTSILEETKSVDKIVDIIEKTIGVPIKTGKYRERAYGVFKQLPEVIRVKVTNDLPTICHELGHYFDKKFGLDDKQFKVELEHLGKYTSLPSYTDKEVRQEGVAEFTRLYMTNPKEAKNKAPNFYDHFETKLDKESLIALNSIRADILNVINLSNVNKIKNDLSVGEARKATKQKTGLLGIFQKAYNAWVDEYAPFARVAKQAKEAGYATKIDTSVEVYRGLVAKVLNNINMAQTDLEGKEIGKSFNEILKPIKKNEVNDFRAYMVARRAIDYHRRNMVMPQPYSIYYDALIALDKKFPHFTDVFNELGEWENNELKLLVDSEMMSQETVDKILVQNPNHVPLQRIQEAVEAVHGGSGSTLGQTKKVIKRAKGSGKTIIDPLESMIYNSFIIRRAAEGNKILGMLYDMANNVEGFGEVVEIVPPGVKGFTFNIEEIKKQLEDMDIDTEGLDLDKLVTLFRANYKERNNEVTYYKNGKPILMELDPELYKAVKGLNRQASHFIIRWLNTPKRILQAGAVTTLQFVMRNMGRDTSTSLIQSEAGINPWDIIRGYASALKKDKWFKQMVSSGGATEYIQINERTQIQNVLDDVLGYTLIDKLKDAVKKPTKENITRLLFTPINKIRSLIDWSEAGPRVAEFRKAVEKGYSTEEAAALSRKLSQDFARHGYYGKEVNKIVAFFNANIQGIERQLRVFKEHPYRSLVRGLLYVTLPTMFLYFLNDENEKYEQMNAWRKALFYNIPLGNPKTAQHYLSLPKPYGWGFLFGALPEIILDGIKDEDPKMWADIRETFAINFDVPYMPSAISPIWEIATNKSWNKTPIESVGDKNKPPYLRYNERSSMAAKTIANALKDVPGVNKISPKQLDYAVKGYTGSVGDFFWRLPDTIKKGVEVGKEVAEKGLGVLDIADMANVPVVKAFITDTAYSNRTINDFYNYGKELNDRLKEARETGVYRAISHLPEEQQRNLVSAIKNATKEYNSLADDFSDARKVIKEIRTSEKFSPTEKKMRERQIQLKMIDIADKFNKKYEMFKKKFDIK